MTDPRPTLVLILLGGCAAEETVRTCTDLATVQVCVDEECTDEVCRGDHVCVEATAQCAPWQSAPLFADFSVYPDPIRSDRLIFRVLRGGFPRRFSEQIRFDFGDGYVGWGEELTHEYDAPGVYPVELVVRMKNFAHLRANRLIEVGAAETKIQLTVNDTPQYLNGQIPFRSNNFTPSDPADDYSANFHLLLPTHGFVVNVTLLETAADPIHQSSLELTANVPLANPDLSSELHFWPPDKFFSQSTERLEVISASWFVPEDNAFPVGTATITLSATTESGQQLTETLMFETVELSPEHDPFDRPMQWLFRFDMDLFTTTPEVLADGTILLTTEAGANGEADFDEELRAIGAQGADRALNAKYSAQIKNAILKEIYRFYEIAPDGSGDIPMTLFADDSAGAPAPETYAEDGLFSMMRMGGTMPNNFGRSWFSEYNELRVDDTEARLGVATARLIQMVVGAPGLTDELHGIKPSTGQVLGTHPQDAVVFADGFDRYAPKNEEAANERYDQLERAANLIALAISAVTAHEMGHAMGLVPNGPPPAGFFGNRVDVSFIGDRTDSHHADFPGLNLMQAGGNLVAVVGDGLGTIEIPEEVTFMDLFEIFIRENRLSPYTRSYFQRRQTYGAF